MDTIKAGGDAMKTMQERLDIHAQWLNGSTTGERFVEGGVDLREAQLCGADLSNITFRCVDLRDVSLRETKLCGATLSGCNLREADLGGADLSKANLWGADLRGADLRGAEMLGADFSGADLRGANLHTSKGIPYATCTWSRNGDHGKELLGALIAGEPRYFCGDFSGSEREIEVRIDREPEYKKMRMIALDFVRSRLAEMKWD